MYSKRRSWAAVPNAFALRMEAKRQAGADLLDLTNSNPTLLDGYPHSEIANAYGASRDFTYHPDSAGSLAARLAIADDYRRHGLEVSAERIFLTTSTSEAYALLFKLLCDPGDEILVPTPSYPLFEYLAAAECVTPIPYRLTYDGNWFIDFESLRAAITDRTRAIVLVSPNNPTGSVIEAEDRLRLIEISQEMATPLIADEVFLDYPLQAASRLLSFAGCEQALTFSLSGLSKTAGMPQVKLGWILVNGSERQSIAAIENLELLCDTFLSVGTAVQNALPDLLRIGSSVRTEIQALILENYRNARKLLSGSAAHPLHADAGWSLIVQLPRTMTEEEWVERLLENSNCIVQPGYFFDLHHRCCVVVSLLTARHDFIRGISLIRDLVAQHA